MSERKAESGSGFDARYKTLDHWRGIAAIAVVYFHAFGSIRNIDTELHVSLRPWKIVSDFGWLGVPIFFVISGYCVTASAYSVQQGNVRIIRFISDRLFRVFPTYWCACLLAIFVNILASPLNGVSWRHDIPAGSKEILANVFLLQPYFGTSLILEVSWSLVFEVAFYIVVTIGLILYRSGASALSLGIMACSLAIFQLAGPFTGLLYFTNFWSQFLLGASVFHCCWLRESQGWRALWPIFVVAILALLPGITQPSFDLLGTTVAVLFALLLFVIYPFDSALASLKAGRSLAWLGKISYSLYLTHCFLGLRLVNLGGRWITNESFGQLPLRLSAVALSVAFAFIFFVMFEQPLEKLRKRIMSSGLCSLPPRPT